MLAIPRLIAARAPEKADVIWYEVLSAARSRATEDGGVAFDNEMLFVSGRRP